MLGDTTRGGKYLTLLGVATLMFYHTLPARDFTISHRRGIDHGIGCWAVVGNINFVQAKEERKRLLIKP